MRIKLIHLKKAPVLLFAFILVASAAKAQLDNINNWTKDGFSYFEAKEGQIFKYDLPDPSKNTLWITSKMLTPAGGKALAIERFFVSADSNRVLIFTNTKKVWRYHTRGDYFVYDIRKKKLTQIGKTLPASSLMFAKLSPVGSNAAFVSGHNIYVESLVSGRLKKLTTDGSTKLINGTFDWAYEEEFECRDGFRWAPDGKSIAYWQIDASKIKNYLMLNTTDSVYPYVVPVEYPTAGQNPGKCRVGVVNLASGVTTWMKVPGDAIQHYIPRMEWANNPAQLILEQLNRAQNQSKIFVCDAKSGFAKLIHQENDKAWIDTRVNAEGGEDPAGWDWLENGKAFVWASEKDGWRHLYKIGIDGKESLITKGNYDVTHVDLINEAEGHIYFTASPFNATQRYLYRIKISGGDAERVSPSNEPGTHEYEISPNGKIAKHNFSNSYTPPLTEIVTLPAHRHLIGDDVIIDSANKPKGSVEFFKVKTADGIDIDGWIQKPTNFDAAKKYPILFYVYGEPAGQTVKDTYGAGFNYEYNGNMADDGYIYISVDNRGTPAPKGREWRKSIYQKIGIINIRDQAMAAKEILKWPFVDSSRVAVWGWSGGGSSTLNLMFQFPEIYKTGIAIAAVGNQLSYDNIYQERYMGVPVDEASRTCFINGSPITYAKNLRGNLLYIHGTGDDNVHYQNAELLINQLIKYNKQFQLMVYPNRTHGISEGEGTSQHLRATYTKFLRDYCPPGAR